MKTVWSFFLLAPLFGMSYCSVVSNVDSQHSSLSKPDLPQITKQQIKHFSTEEPFVAYNKLENGTLELFGTAFGNRVTDDKILFLQENILIFNIHTVVLKWFHFDEKMLKIFDIFDEKLQKSVKSFTIEKCYFPKGLRFKTSLELKYVTNCSFIQCFSNEKSFKEMFKIFKSAPVTSLTISKVLDYTSFGFFDRNITIKKATLGVTRRLVKINDLELNEFFRDVQFLSLSSSLLDFAHFSLTSLQKLNYVDLSHTDSENLRVKKLFKCLPTNLERITLTEPDIYYNPSFIENAFAKNIIIDPKYPFNYVKIDCVKTLSVFSSLDFDMNAMNGEMITIKKYVESIGSAISTVTSVEFSMRFNYQSVVNMLTLLSYFPKLDSVKVRFYGNCDAFLDDGDIQPTVSTPSVKYVKKLSIYFKQEKETNEFYHFVVEIMELFREVSSLEFIYAKSNSFAIKIAEMVEREDIQFTNLDTFLVKCIYGNSDISVDLFYVAKYKIKNLTIDTRCSIQSFDRVNQYECPSVDNLTIDLRNYNTFEGVINNFLTKFPNVTNFSWKCDTYRFLLPNSLLNMQKLKKVIVDGAFVRSDFDSFLSLLPSDLESLEVECYMNSMEEMEKIKSVFYGKFPNATLILTAL